MFLYSFYFYCYCYLTLHVFWFCLFLSIYLYLFLTLCCFNTGSPEGINEGLSYLIFSFLMTVPGFNDIWFFVWKIQSRKLQQTENTSSKLNKILDIWDSTFQKLSEKECFFLIIHNASLWKIIHQTSYPVIWWVKLENPL